MEQTMFVVENESIENLLLAAVLGQGTAKESALRELRKRKTLRQEVDFEDLYMANFSAAAF
jgi:hypothetical protein